MKFRPYASITEMLYIIYDLPSTRINLKKRHFSHATPRSDRIYSGSFSFNVRHRAIKIFLRGGESLLPVKRSARIAQNLRRCVLADDSKASRRG